MKQNPQYYMSLKQQACFIPDNLQQYIKKQASVWCQNTTNKHKATAYLANKHVTEQLP